MVMMIVMRWWLFFCVQCVLQVLVVAFPEATTSTSTKNARVKYAFQRSAECHDLESLLVTWSEHAFQFLLQAFVQKRVGPPGAPLVTQQVGHMCNHVVFERELGAFDRKLRDITHRCVLLCSACGEEKKAVRFHVLRPQAERITRHQQIQVQLGHARDGLTAPSLVPRKHFAAQRRHADFDRFRLGRLESAPYASREQLPHRVPDHALHGPKKKRACNRSNKMTRFGVTANSEF